MRLKLIPLLTLLVTTVLANVSHANQSVELQFLHRFQQEVLQRDSLQLQKRLNALAESLELLTKNQSPDGIKRVQNNYRKLVLNWKKVEVVYLAGMLDSDFLDHPRYIDFFHQGNESIPALLDRVLMSSTGLDKALFKYSTRSITALDYLLFPKVDAKNIVDPWQENSRRRIEMARVMVKSLQSWIGEIAEFYALDEAIFQSSNQSVSALFNALVSSSYKLKNWRVGEAIGMVSKYENRPSAQRLEYRFSEQSMNAVTTILKVHQQVFFVAEETGLFQLNENDNAGQIRFIRARIDSALEKSLTITGDVSTQLESTELKEVFHSLSQLHDAYFFMLIDALGIDPLIIDADGD